MSFEPVVMINGFPLPAGRPHGTTNVASPNSREGRFSSFLELDRRGRDRVEFRGGEHAGVDFGLPLFVQGPALFGGPGEPKWERV